MLALEINIDTWPRNLMLGCKKKGMSKESRPPHRNRWTKDLLLNREQVCPACHLNFGTTKAGDAHLIGEFGIDRRCANPNDVGLVSVENKFSTLVWRFPND